VSVERLLLRLDPEGAGAWAAYDKLRRKLVKFFAWQRCDDPEELAGVVLDRLAARPDLDEIRSIPSFAIGVARMVTLESRARARREVHLEDLAGAAGRLADPQSREDAAERLGRQHEIACLRKSLATLTVPDRTLAVEYYRAEGVKQYVQRRVLALRYGFTANALRVHMNRLRERLEHEVLDCLAGRRER
jgi:hypothetical protein